ncbi:TPA: glycosyltransferase family 4 protein [Photobacterium damselae]
MRKLLIVTNGTLPIPSVKGGAAETLLQTFIDYNERNPKFNICIFSILDDIALEYSNEYKHTKYIYIDSNPVWYKLSRAIRFLINNYTPFTIKNKFISEVLKYKTIFKESDLNLVICNPYYSTYINDISSSPIGLHLHNDYLNIESVKLDKRIIGHYDFLICVSDYIKSQVESALTYPVDIRRVYNGIDVDRFHCKSEGEIERLKSKYNINKNDKVIIFTGRLIESKGIKVLIEVFLEIMNAYSIKLIIVGSSGFKNSSKTSFNRELESLTHKALGNIIFTGFIDNNNIQNIYHLADFCVLPSLTTEAFPLTALEAMAAGLPVIVTDAGGMSETIDTSCGFIIKRDDLFRDKLKNAIIKLLDDQELRDSMSRSSLERSEMFRNELYINNLISVLLSQCE